MPVYSHSRISCFGQCPFRFRLKYIDKVRPEIEQTIEAFMGSLVHKVLEKLYRDLRFKKLNTIQSLLRFYNEQWRKNWSPAILLVRKEYTPENYRQMGEEYIRNYYSRHHPFDQTRTVGLEQRLMIDLNGDGKFRMQGYMDRLALSRDGVYEIHDYKTNASLPLKQYLEEDRQLALYAIAVKESYPNAEEIRLVWHFLSFNQDVMMKKTEEELERLRRETIETIKEIESTRNFPTRTSVLCSWCEFRPMCPEWAHIAKTEGMTLNRFLREPGVKLVNRYAELTDQKKKLEQEMEKVKEALVRTARESGSSVISGSGYNAKVWSAEKLRFPGKNEEGRQELEDFLQKAGLWKDVATVDAFTLSRMMEKPPWPEEIARAIAKFGRKELIERIYLRKKNDFGQSF
jgi:putative RecB family exonuclease